MTNDKPDIESLKKLAGSIIDAFESLAEDQGFDSFEEWADHIEAQRFDYEPEHGIYENAELTTPDGGSFRLRNVYFWSTNLRGERLVDIPDGQLPNGLSLADCSFSLYSDNGVPLFRGPIKDEGNPTLGDSRCIVVEPVRPSERDEARH